MTATTTEQARYGFDDLRRLMALQTGDEKHEEASTSTLDVTWVLYDQVLDVAPDRVDDPLRDRFLLSKGHGPVAYYAVLAAKGYIPVAWLSDFGSFGSPLGYHPDRNLVPGVEISSGSLGHGLPLAIGTTLGLRAQGIRSRVVTLVGDGELDEGTNAEAIAVAARLGLDRLTVVAIDNQTSSLGWPGGLEERFAVEGWVTRRVDGRDHVGLRHALSQTDEHAPTLVVAEIEGYG